MEKSLLILYIYYFQIIRVEKFELCNNALNSTFVVLSQHLLAHFGAYGGHQVDSLAHGIYIEHRASAHHGIVALGKEARKQCKHISLKFGCAVIVGNALESHKVVLCQGLFVGSGSCGANGNLAENLARIGRDYLSAERTRYLYSRSSLPHTGGSGNHYECLFLHHVAKLIKHGQKSTL